MHEEFFIHSSLMKAESFFEQETLWSGGLTSLDEESASLNSWENISTVMEVDFFFIPAVTNLWLKHTQKTSNNTKEPNFYFYVIEK